MLNAARLQEEVPIREGERRAGRVTTSDGVRLHYVETGSGKPVVMIPGWSQTAEELKYQLDELCDRYRLIALGMRGHGCGPTLANRGYDLRPDLRL